MTSRDETLRALVAKWREDAATWSKDHPRRDAIIACAAGLEYAVAALQGIDTSTDTAAVNAYKFDLAAVRETCAISQAELAERAGTSQPAISMIENGRRTPSFATICKLAVALGREPWRLVQEATTGGPPEPAAPATGRASDESRPRSCNRHRDCDAADAKAVAEGRSPYAHHCHDDCCEDCFGA